jgi:hypothetical protein
MTRSLLVPMIVVVVSGLLGCEQSSTDSRQIARADVAMVSEALAKSSVAAPQNSAVAAAEARACVAVEAGDCDDLQMQLEAARRALARNQAERAQLPGAVNLQIKFVVQGRPLQLDQPYGLAVGDVRVRAIRYWLSQLSFITADGSSTEIADSYYLMEARGKQQLSGGTQAAITLPAKRRELIVLPSVPTSTYTKIAFNVGVDAAHNDDLSLTAGELTVLQNMASVQWMWFTSYIFTQLDALIAGDLNDVQEDGGVPIDLQLRWENGTNQDLRRVELTLPSPASIGAGGPLTNIEVELDVAVLFNELGAELQAARDTMPSSPMSSIGAATEAQRTVLADNWSRAFRALGVVYGTP